MLLLKKVERPRELKWHQAGAMLYGDWGTSKAYVIGIAFALAGHASWFFLGLMSLLTFVIGICYMIICRVYPDGGGVYSAVQTRSKTLAVIGAFLLIADYVVTASLSALEAFHYFNFPHPEMWAIGSILLIGTINWIGPTKGGSIAEIIAIIASLVAAVLFVFTLPHLPHVELTMPEGNWYENWSVFVGVVLALSGVEAIANMTGIMVEPVEKTSRKAIWPVMLEVSILTFLLGIAMNAIPGLQGHAEDMLRVLGHHYVGPWYGHVISVVFGFLLLSAANTAITGIVSVQFLMAKNRELPAVFSRLNRFGMPHVALIVAVVIPSVVLLLQHDIVQLAALYAIGVVGAITLNLGSCATNRQVTLKTWERGLLIVSAVILFLIECTIIVQKHNALIFATAVLGTGMILRAMAKKLIPVVVPEELAAVNVLTVTEAKELEHLYRSTTLVALKTLNTTLLDEAYLRIKAKGENSVYLAYVEETPPAREVPIEVEPSTRSLELLGMAQRKMEEKGITAIPIWRMGSDPGKLIADAAAELAVDSVMIGTTKRSALINLLRGDVFRSLAKRLPANCHLTITG